MACECFNCENVIPHKLTKIFVIAYILYSTKFFAIKKAL